MKSYKDIDISGKSGIIKKKKESLIYKQFDINDQKGYDEWVNAYYSKNCQLTGGVSL